ncbi:MAG: hypothetical protein QOC95_326 [Thermoleophilaceae bacterium]|jgi:hypothetical protein|nr:hypothetical protein [Thermoleophilaceae bacterium]
MRLWPVVLRAGRSLGRGSKQVRLTRWRLIRAVSVLLGAFVAFNGLTGALGGNGDAVTWVSAAVVVALGAAVALVGTRLAGPRPR